MAISVTPEEGDDDLRQESVAKLIGDYLNYCQQQIDAYEANPKKRWLLWGSKPMIFRSQKKLVRAIKICTGVDIKLATRDVQITDERKTDLDSGALHTFHTLSNDLHSDRNLLQQYKNLTWPQVEKR